MRHSPDLHRSWRRAVLLGMALLMLPAAVRADDTHSARGEGSGDRLSKSLDLVQKGQFDAAAAEVKKLDANSEMVRKVTSWLEKFEADQASRRAMNLADMEKYVGYAKQRYERKEYAAALAWSLAAADVAPDREELLKADWLKSLVNDALIEADRDRKDHEWRDAWYTYYRLAELYDHEPRYKKLERDMLTHLRLDLMFEPDNHWEERLENVRFTDAESALEYIERLYVKPADFKKISESALEHVLILSESVSAQARFQRLADADDRTAFQKRIESNLDQVRKEPTYGRKDVRRLFARVLEINDETVQIPKALLVSEMMRGAFAPLDEYTTIIWPAEADEFDKHTRGDFVGVGISIVKNGTDEIEVASPLEDTPAFKAGIQAGDVITKVDGRPLKGFSLNKTVDTITGPKGTTVTLGVRRDGKEIEVPLRREVIKIRSVKGMARDEKDAQKWNHWLDKDMGVGYARINSFQSNTVEDLYNVIADLQTQGLRGMVLDLRGNPGGLLTSAHEMASLFLPKGAGVVSTKGRIPSEDQSLEAAFEGEGPFPDLPLIVLVDEHSASASEIVSGALRDNKRAVVLGQRTFGKFSVQNLIPLSRSNAKLKITTAKYFLPGGDSLHRDDDSRRWGVDPNISVPLVNKEQFNLYQMRRDAERIGPAAKTDKVADAAGAGNEPAPKVIIEDGELLEEVVPGVKTATEDKDKPKRVYERFKIKGVDPSRVTISFADDGKAPADPAAAVPAAEGDKPADADKPKDEKPKGPPIVKVSDKPAAVVARDAAGNELKLSDVEMDGDHLKVYAVNDKGEKVEVHSLSLEGKVAIKDTLPPLEQPDENTRPKTDPQLDAALLVMRAKLVDKDLSKIASAEVKPKNDSAHP